MSEKVGQIETVVASRLPLLREGGWRQVASWKQGLELIGQSCPSFSNLHACHPARLLAPEVIGGVVSAMVMSLFVLRAFYVVAITIATCKFPLWN
jgi:hypothetical protein